jgi:hypothetical protein
MSGGHLRLGQMAFPGKYDQTLVFSLTRTAASGIVSGSSIAGADTVQQIKICDPSMEQLTTTL